MTDLLPGNGGTHFDRCHGCAIPDEVAELRARVKINDGNITTMYIETRSLAIELRSAIAQQKNQTEQQQQHLDRFHKLLEDMACQVRSVGEIVLKMKHRGKK